MHTIRVKLLLLIAGQMAVALNLRIRGTLELASTGVLQNVTID